MSDAESECTCGSTTLNHGTDPNCPVHGESVEGEAGGESVTLWRWKDPEQPYDRHGTDWQTSSPPVEPGFNDYEVRTFVSESSLNAALARAEEAERERDEARASESRAYQRVVSAESKADKLEALAAGQAATLEQIREKAIPYTGRCSACGRRMGPDPMDFYHTGSHTPFAEVIPETYDIFNLPASLLNPKESKHGTD